MTLKLNVMKRNPKTNKLEKTGQQDTIGNVSRGSAGGYTKGAIDGLVETPQLRPALSGPVYAPPPPPSTSSLVPNTSTMNGPVYTPPPNNAPPEGGAIPNSSSLYGPVSTPAPVSSQSPEAVPSSSPVAPAVPSSSSPSPAGAQEQAVPFSQSSYNYLSDWFNNTPLGYFLGRNDSDPRFSRNGPDPLDFIPSGGGVVVAGTRAAAKAAAREVGEKGSVKLIQNLEKTGAQLMKPGGAEILSSTIAPASGVLKTAAKAGTTSFSSKTLLQKAKYIKEVSSLFVYPAVLAGGIYSQVKISEAGETAIDDDLTAFTASFPKDIVALEEAGYYDEANEIKNCAEGVKTALDSGAFDNVFTGKSKGLQAVNVCKTNLNEGLLQVAKDKAAKDKQDIIAAQKEATAAAVAAATAKTTEEENKQTFQKEQTIQQQRFQTSEREARQAYEQSVREGAAATKQFDEDTATTSSEGGTLSFGLLGGGGSTEFVDRDTASNAYFGKPYSELTPAQQRLLNLLKGKGQ